MLKPAHLYQEQLKQRMLNTWYDPEYQWYYDANPYIPEFPDYPDNYRQFVSVDKNDNVIGYFSYKFNPATRRAFNFGIINFTEDKLTFGKDLKSFIEDIFWKYGLSFIEFFAFVENPAIDMYNKFIQTYGGRKVGMLRQAAMTQDGNPHDVFLFEIARSDLSWKPVDGKMKLIKNNKPSFKEIFKEFQENYKEDLLKWEQMI